MAACTLLAGVKAVPVHAGAGLTCGLAGDELGGLPADDKLSFIRC